MHTVSGSALSLGGPVNLLAGLRPVFASVDLPWAVPAQRPIMTEPLVVPPDPVVWDPPILSLHHGAADLLGALFDYAISPMAGLDGPMTTGAGPLMTGPDADLAPMAARLRLDLGARTYVLVRIKGLRGTTYFQPEFLGLNRKKKIIDWLSPQGRKAVARLRLTQMRREGVLFHGDITARQARRYLSYFDEMGTHILRGLGFGDLMYQVFEVAPDQVGGLQRIFAQEAQGDVITGAAAFGMYPFTCAPWVTRASPILTASDDDMSDAIRSDPIWHPPQGGPPSLLSGAAIDAHRREQVLAGLPAQSVIAASFACQALYLEDFRADAWTRLLRGAMSHRFPGLDQTGWRAQGAFDAVAFAQSAELHGDAGLCPRPGDAVGGVSFALDVAASDLDQSDHLTFFARADPGSGGAVRRRLDGTTFDPRRFKAPFASGAYEVQGQGGSRATLVQGVWLGTVPGGGFAVLADPAADASDHLLRFEGKLSRYVRLLDQMRGPAFAPEVRDFARRCAMWLAGNAKGAPSLAPLRWTAAQVAHGNGWVSQDPALPALTDRVRDAVSLMALAPNMAALGRNGQALAMQVAAIHDRALDGQDPTALGAAYAQAVDALSQDCAARIARADQPDIVRSVFSAVAGLTLPPDHRHVPHAMLPGTDPVPLLWNGLLSLRAQGAETLAICAALDGDPAGATELLGREPIPPCQAVQDPAHDILEALAQMQGTPVTDAQTLRRTMAKLGAMARMATHMQRQAVARSASDLAHGDPQMLRLVTVLEVLNLCHAAGLPVARLTDLSPQSIVARLEAVLDAADQSPLRKASDTKCPPKANELDKA